MNREPLFGMKPSFLGKQSTSIIKGFLQNRYKLDGKTKLPLTTVPSPLYPGLSLVANGSESSPPVGKGLVVGSIRMGYGHHRMALSVYSHSLALGKPTLLHDLLALDSPESRAIADIDHGYSYFSRLSAEMGGIVEWAWGQLMAQGNISSLDLSTQMAMLYKNLMSEIPKDNPVITTYPLNGQIAVANEFQNVIHLICDNFPQHFLLVPGAKNLVQTPSAYTKFIQMGVPKENLEYAGHWVSEDLVKNAISDSQTRIKRLETGKKRRYLIPIGGAGAQKGYITELLEKTKSELLTKRVFYFINTGDHTKVLNALEEFLHTSKIPFETILTWEDMKQFLLRVPLTSEEPENLASVILFNFPTHTEAFSATDVLMRYVDVLMTKPSELAFFPIPKLFIRRVGDHEAASVARAIELGEGTVECREPKHAVEFIHLFQDKTDTLLRMNDRVIRNSEDQVYSGSLKAVQMSGI